MVLYIFALKPLSKLMKERSDKISKGLNDAKSNAVMLEQTKEEREKILAEARKEAQKIFEAGKKEEESNKAQMIEEAKRSVEVVVENGKKAIEMEKVKMVADVKKEVTSLALAAAEKIIASSGGSLNEKTVKELKSL